MVQEVTVDLGNFSIYSHLDTDFVLHLTTSMLLYLPDQYSEAPTATELGDQVKAGLLWITGAGSCQFELNIGLTDSLQPGSREQLQRMIVDAFEAFPAWNSLGLKLKRDYNQFNGLQGARSLYPYSVHHHQQHSGLINPDQVPCAYFSALSCIFTFGAPDTEGIKHSGNFVVNTPPHRKSKIATLQVPPSNLRAIIGIPHIYSLPSAAQKTRLERLTHTALHLILGSKKRIAGMRTLNHAGSTPVLEIAPAVWSSQYFQDVVSRAQMAPLISSPLGALMSSQSEGLRLKIQSLAIDPVEELHRQTLLLILRSARVSKTQKRSQRSSSLPGDIAELHDEYGQVQYPEDSQEGAEVLGSIHWADDLPIDEHVLSPDEFQPDDDDYMPDLVQDDNYLPAYGDFYDEEPLSEQDIEHDIGLDEENDVLDSRSELTDSQIDPELLWESGELDSQPRLDVEVPEEDVYPREDVYWREDDVMQRQHHSSYHHDMDPDAFEADGSDAVLQQHQDLLADDMDEDYEGDSHDDPPEGHIRWRRGHHDMDRDHDKLGDESMFEDQVLDDDDDDVYGAYSDDVVSHQHYDMPLDGMVRAHLQDAPRSRSEEPVQRHHDHHVRDLHYESDFEMDHVDEPMSDGAWDYMDQDPEEFDEPYQYRSYGTFADENHLAADDEDADELETIGDARYRGTEESEFDIEEDGDELPYLDADDTEHVLYGQNVLSSAATSHHLHDPTENDVASQMTTAFYLNLWGLGEIGLEA